MIRGFILDVTDFFDEDEITDLGISTDLVNLKKANDGFADLYNQRAKEKSTVTAELTKELRSTTEELYRLLALHLEFKANTDNTEVGMACSESLAVINQFVKDARTRLNARLGKVQDPEIDTPETTETPETPEE